MSTTETQTQESIDSATGEVRENPQANIATAADSPSYELAEPVRRRGIDEATWRTLKSSIFPGALNDSILMAVDYCKARKLDVLKKPCHIVPMEIHDKKTNSWAWRDVIMAGIYEHRITAMRTNTFAGNDPPQFGANIEYKGVTAPEFVTYTVYRFVAGHKVPFPATVFFTEAVGLKDKGSKVNAMWTKRPRGQLEKCAEAAALRKAFPEELGGEMTVDEMGGEGHGVDPNPDPAGGQSRTSAATEALRNKIVSEQGRTPGQPAAQREPADLKSPAEGKAPNPEKSRTSEWDMTKANEKAENAAGFNVKTATDLLRSQKNLADLKTAWEMVRSNYTARKLEIPVDIEALYGDRKEMFEEQEQRK